MKTCVVCGTGNRGTGAFLCAMKEEIADCVKLLGVYDMNPKRCTAALEYAGVTAPIFEDFDKMLEETKPDIVIVTTKDSTHDEYIIKALEAGCDVVSEKPMTTDEVKCNAILEAEKRTGKKVTVTFNCRFLPFYVRVKELLKEKVIGDIYSVHYEWMLDTSHGADYFRRWHRERRNSGSLLIHKSTHHFDLLNWWLDDEPESVNAYGTRRFYGPTREKRGERCLTCAYKKTCEFYMDINATPFYKSFYLNCEDVDGYWRDGCVFSDVIDIEDSVALNIRYAGGPVVSYSLTAHSPYEGMKIVFNGSEGRMEVESTDIKAFGGTKTIRVFNRMQEVLTYQFAPGSMLTKTAIGVDKSLLDTMGGHGGSDPLMRAAIFRGVESDPLGQLADTRAGAMSLAIGAAANISMREKRAVSIRELYDFLK